MLSDKAKERLRGLAHPPKQAARETSSDLAAELAQLKRRVEATESDLGSLHEIEGDQK